MLARQFDNMGMEAEVVWKKLVRKLSDRWPKLMAHAEILGLVHWPTGS